ncbi:MAG: SGNH/GDSL hydrolase family protein [Planctomycetaceae bacterium]|nr:SGNH/GDSL hydrolase family protein [Planctomycetaceae bacterium]MBT4014057.1 SGNH/GDSL hydrolase family protein [Planctomycetaceae bacterium]MBT4724759.1 SGNH/GDSL hydrolase family protein [Planctomycetaceae bacterium]MBT4844096.1 SGNH/GDSL hydrolase family protein [Planctomycetaceae bacterium]MBT5124329.1 SGNH/GDSL hydrolase family protein [Planctomycetaceae bacterium]
MIRDTQVLVCIAISILFCSGVSADTKPLIKSGDRVVFLGGTFVERMQNYGHVEAEISSRVSGVTFRNLGWSGDNVWGESRAVFGTVSQGFERLQRDMTLAQPSVIIVSYGANEAHAGNAGLSRFVLGYQTLLDALKLHEASVILVTPRYYENLGPPLPDPGGYNAKLKLYIDAIDSLATEQNLPVIHLSKPESSGQAGVKHELRPKSWRVLPAHSGLTNNGIHLTSQGYQVLARQIADDLKLPKSIFSVSGMQGTNVNISDYIALPDSIRFVMTPTRIVSLDMSGHGNDEVKANLVHLRFDDLRPGKYAIYIDDTKLARVTANQLKIGVALPSSFQHATAKRAYELTAAKNMMFFHRHRPQNETYLFLFRKHEQGNNAVEVPQFDPIIDGFENNIQSIQNSTSYRVEIRRS